MTYIPITSSSIANDAVTDAKLRNSAGLSVIGRASNSTGDPADIVAANDGEVLVRTGTTLGFSTVSSVPTGVVLPYAAATAPTGYLLCDGSAVSRATYATLFGVIADVYGIGDGSTTFNLPDMRQRFPMGKAAAGTGATLGGTGGTIDHTHAVNIGPTVTSVEVEASVNVITAGAVAVAAGSHTHSVDPASTNSDAKNPPFQTFTFIIKT